MQSLANGHSSDTAPAQCDELRVAEISSAERRYKHICKLSDSQKLRHNSWVLGSARARQAHCLVLDGVNLFTTKTLIDGGIPASRIHVPNKSDYDAIIASSHSFHGNIYRCSALQWTQALVSLAPPAAAEPISSSFAGVCGFIKTIWLDYTCRWSSHVERALALLLSPSVMGASSSDLYITLNADTRCPSALHLDGVQKYIADSVTRTGGSVEFPSDHCEEYGNGMFILLAVVNWGSCSNRAIAGAELYERLIAEAYAFRKKENSLKASAE